MSFLAELKRRNVIRMGGLYIVGAWLIIQVAETLLPIFETPGWVLKTLVLLLAIGFLPALAPQHLSCPAVGDGDFSCDGPPTAQ